MRCPSRAERSGKNDDIANAFRFIGATSGGIRFLGRESINRLEIGYLPQHPAFFSWMTALEYMVFAARLSKMKRREALKRVEPLCAMSVWKRKKTGKSAVFQEE